MKLIVQIPCYNEEKTLPETVRDIPRQIKGVDNVEILIIDDQPNDLRLLSQLLSEHSDFRVFSATSGQEGIALMARRRPHLVILDLRMPEMDGFAVLNEMRSNPELANTPVLVVTGEIDFNA